MGREPKITLSEKHGLNPSLACCFACGKEYGVAILGKLKDDKEAPKYILTQDLCDECKKFIDDGYILCIGYSEVLRGEPVRTGELLKIKEAAFKRVFEMEAPEKKICFMHKDVIQKIVKCSKEK